MNAIVGHNIAWSGGLPTGIDPEDIRNIGRGIAEHGYQWWHDATYPRLKTMGFTRFERHNPFGAESDEPMDLDQLLELQSTWWRAMRRYPGRLAKLSGGGWRAATLKHLTDAGCEAIDYYGTVKWDADMRKREDDYAAWHSRAIKSLKPSLDAGSTVGFDASSGLARDSWGYKLIRDLTNAGHRCVIEAWPNKDAKHLHDLPVLMKYGHSYGTFQTSGKSPGDQLTGEIMVVGVNTIEKAREVRGNGHTCIIAPELARPYVEIFGDDE